MLLLLLIVVVVAAGVADVVASVAANRPSCQWKRGIVGSCLSLRKSLDLAVTAASSKVRTTKLF